MADKNKGNEPQAQADLPESKMGVLDDKPSKVSSGKRKPKASAKSNTVASAVEAVYKDAPVDVRVAIAAALEAISSDATAIDAQKGNEAIRKAFYDHAIQSVEIAQSDGLDAALLDTVEAIAESRNLDVSTLFSRRGARELAVILQEAYGNHDIYDVQAEAVK